MKKIISIYIKRFVRLSVSLCVTFCLSPGDKQFVCPLGDKHFSHRGGRGDKHFCIEGGGQTFFVGGGGGHDDVDEEMDVS